MGEQDCGVDLVYDRSLAVQLQEVGQGATIEAEELVHRVADLALRSNSETVGTERSEENGAEAKRDIGVNDGFRVSEAPSCERRQRSYLVAPKGCTCPCKGGNRPLV